MIEGLTLQHWILGHVGGWWCTALPMPLLNAMPLFVPMLVLAPSPMMQLLSISDAVGLWGGLPDAWAALPRLKVGWGPWFLLGSCVCVCLGWLCFRSSAHVVKPETANRALMPAYLLLKPP